MAEWSDDAMAGVAGDQAVDLAEFLRQEVQAAQASLGRQALIGGSSIAGQRRPLGPKGRSPTLAADSA